MNRQSQQLSAINADLINVVVDRLPGPFQQAIPGSGGNTPLLCGKANTYAVAAASIIVLSALTLSTITPFVAFLAITAFLELSGYDPAALQRKRTADPVGTA